MMHMKHAAGAQGIVVGPSCSQSSRVAVRFNSAPECSGDNDSGEDVVPLAVSEVFSTSSVL